MAKWQPNHQSIYFDSFSSPPPNYIPRSATELTKCDVDDSENAIKTFSTIISTLFQVVLKAKCVLSILELNWYEQFGNKETICRQVIKSSQAQPQNRSFSLQRRGSDENDSEMYKKGKKKKKARAKRAKVLFLHF